jgi:hypothetical protein
MAATTTITVGTIVNDVILMISDDSYLNGAKNYHIKYLATQALKEFSFDLMKDVKSTGLTVGEAGTVNLPDDYIKYTKIGVLGSDDRIHSLGVKRNLNLVHTATAGDSSDSDSDPSYFFGVGRRFGVGGGNNNNGYYRENAEDNTISFSSELIGKTIILEYIGISSAIHKFAEEALRAYIYYKYIQTKRGVPLTEKQIAKRNYYNEKRLAVARMKSFTKDEALQASRKGFKQSPKM